MNYRTARDVPNVSIYQSPSANPENCARIRRCLTVLYGPATESDMGGRWPHGERHHSAKLAYADVEGIRERLADGEGLSAIGREFDIKPSTVAAVRDGKSWSRGDGHSEPAWREIVRPNGMIVFRLNRSASVPLHEICPSRQVGLWFVQEMTAAQLELFIHVSTLADGHYRPSGGCDVTQKNPAMLDALELAAILSGRRARRYSREHEGFTAHTSHHLEIMAPGRDRADFQHGGITRTTYTGTVWCPTTANRSWLARYDGSVFYTGNSAWTASDEERRVAIQPDMELGAWALQRLFVQRELRVAKVPEAEIAQHYVEVDLTGLAVHTNRQEDSRQLYDRGVLSGERAMESSGFDPDADMLEGAEYVRALGWKIGNPVLALYDTLEYDTLDWDRVANVGRVNRGPVAGSPADAPHREPGSGPEPGSPGSEDTDTPKVDRPD